MTKNSSNKERSSNQIVHHLAKKIMEGGYAAGQYLPPERMLAKEFGVGRPTVREALQQLEREGWISIRKGHPAVVNDYWKQGNISTLVTIIHNQEAVTDQFIVYLLEIRAALTPVYIHDAIKLHQAKVVSFLANLEELTDDAKTFASFDWNLQKGLASLSPNPVYLLLLNSFNTFYLDMAQLYFSVKEHRQFTYQYYERLLDLALKGDFEKAEDLVRETMEKSIELWRNRK